MFFNNKREQSSLIHTPSSLLLRRIEHVLVLAASAYTAKHVLTRLADGASALRHQATVASATKAALSAEDKASDEVCFEWRHVFAAKIVSHFN